MPLKITLTVEMNGLYFASAGSVVITDLTNIGDVNQIKEQIAPYPEQLESSEVIESFNTGYYINSVGGLTKSSSFIYSDFYPVESFVKVTGMIKNSAVANIAYYKLPYFYGSCVGTYLGSSTANTGVTIDRETFEANMPAGAKYFAISVEQKATNVVKLYLHSFKMSTIENSIAGITPHVFVPSTINAQDIMNISAYWNDSTNTFTPVSSSNGWKRTPYLDLDVYKRIEATIPLQGNNWSQVIYFNANKE